MATVNTNDLRIQNAKNLISSIRSDEEDSYMFVGRAIPWFDESNPSNLINDENPPIPENNWKEFYDTYNQMLSLKRISNTDAVHVIPKITWRSGITFDMYRHDYSYKLPSSSGATDLYDCVFYCINQNNDVYVCLYNGTTPENRRGVPSTVEPQNLSTLEPFYTSDGYQWMYLSTMSSYYMSNRTTNNFMPVPEIATSGQPEGVIHTVLINSRGNGYSSHPDGVLNTIPYYFCRITGDGQEAVARVSVSNGSIQTIEVVRPGYGYSRATLDFSANRIFKSLADLDANENALDPLGDGSFKSTCIISPPKGWGTDCARELGGTRVALFSNFESDQDDFLTGTEFRQLGVVHDPELANIEDGRAINLCAHYAIHVDGTDSFTFTVGEEIRQVDSEGRVSKGTVVSWNSKTRVLRYVQDPKYNSDVDGQVYPFSGQDTEIVAQTTGWSFLATNYTGFYSEESLRFVEGYAVPEIVKFSGRFTYLTNIKPVLRQYTQNESISLIISY